MDNHNRDRGGRERSRGRRSYQRSLWTRGASKRNYSEKDPSTCQDGNVRIQQLPEKASNDPSTPVDPEILTRRDSTEKHSEQNREVPHTPNRPSRLEQDGRVDNQTPPSSYGHSTDRRNGDHFGRGSRGRGRDRLARNRGDRSMPQGQRQPPNDSRQHNARHGNPSRSDRKQADGEPRSRGEDLKMLVPSSEEEESRMLQLAIQESKKLADERRAFLSATSGVDQMNLSDSEVSVDIAESVKQIKAYDASNHQSLSLPQSAGEPAAMPKPVPHASGSAKDPVTQKADAIKASSPLSVEPPLRTSTAAATTHDWNKFGAKPKGTVFNGTVRGPAGRGIAKGVDAREPTLMGSFLSGTKPPMNSISIIPFTPVAQEGPPPAAAETSAPSSADTPIATSTTGPPSLKHKSVQRRMPPAFPLQTKTADTAGSTSPIGVSSANGNTDTAVRCADVKTVADDAGMFEQSGSRNSSGVLESSCRAASVTLPDPATSVDPVDHISPPCPSDGKEQPAVAACEDVSAQHRTTSEKCEPPVDTTVSPHDEQTLLDAQSPHSIGGGIDETLVSDSDQTVDVSDLDQTVDVSDLDQTVDVYRGDAPHEVVAMHSPGVVPLPGISQILFPVPGFISFSAPGYPIGYAAAAAAAPYAHHLRPQYHAPLLSTPDGHLIHSGFPPAFPVDYSAYLPRYAAAPVRHVDAPQYVSHPVPSVVEEPLHEEQLSPVVSHTPLSADAQPFVQQEHRRGGVGHNAYRKPRHNPRYRNYSREGPRGNYRDFYPRHNEFGGNPGFNPAYGASQRNQTFYGRETQEEDWCYQQQQQQYDAGQEGMVNYYNSGNFAFAQYRGHFQHNH